MTRLVWAAILAQFGLIVASLTLPILSEATTSRGGEIAVRLAFGIVTLAFPTTGAIVLARRASHPVGRLLGVSALGWAMANAAASYATYSVARSAGALPATDWALWLTGNSWPIVTSQGCLLLVLLLFPTGSLPTRAWRPVRWAVLGWTALTAAAIAFAAGPLDDILGLRIMNPAAAPDPTGTFLRALTAPLQLAYLPLFGAVLVALVTRFRRARGLERQQLKWIAAAASFVTAILALLIGSLGLVPLAGIEGGEPSAWAYLAIIAATLSPGLLPISIAVAILRYRLYDIDLLINRTLVYGATTATIAITFFLGILALQTLLRQFTSGSELAIAASTLVSFALFQPLRRRVQDAVDRRFDRSRYDAARTLDAFADRLRDEVDLGVLRRELLGTVSSTMAPAYTSLWLRERSRGLNV